MANTHSPAIRVRKTPNGRHLYAATAKGYGAYGWGNTPDAARTKLAENMALEDADRAALSKATGEKTADPIQSFHENCEGY